LPNRSRTPIDVTVNDVVLAAVGGGLRKLLDSRGESVDELVLRVMVPISLHQEQPFKHGATWTE
jgi:hypothetical protein